MVICSLLQLKKLLCWAQNVVNMNNEHQLHVEIYDYRFIILPSDGYEHMYQINITTYSV